MTPRWFLALPLILLPPLWACKSDDPGTVTEDDDDDETTTGSGTDTATITTPETVLPTGDRILLSYSHGGCPPYSSGRAEFEGADKRWKAAFGWNTDHRDYLPDDLSDYRFIGFVAPGCASGKSFTDEEIAALAGALEIGTRVAIFADRDSCSSDPAAALLSGLGVSLGFTGDGADDNQLIDAADGNSQHQISAGLSDSVRFKEPCWVQSNKGEAVLADDDNLLIAAERPGYGGEVVVVGDYQFMDDSGFLDSGANGELADNLVRVEP